MELGKTLAELRKECGMSQAQAAEYLTGWGCEVTQKVISKWERGVNTPNGVQLLYLCRAYNVRDVLWVFLGMDGALSSLNSLGKKRVEEYIHLLENDSRFSSRIQEQPLPVRSLPLYDLPVSAGTGQFLDSSDYELIDVDGAVPISATFAVRISGDSMTPRFADRQIVYIKQQQTLNDGEVGIFLLNGNAYCKVFGGTSLVSLNKKYDPIPVSEFDEFRILGKVVG